MICVLLFELKVAAELESTKYQSLPFLLMESNDSCSFDLPLPRMFGEHS